MSFGNFGQLRAAIATWAKRSDQTANIYDFITWAHQEICRKLRAPLLYKTATLTLGTETVAAPPDFLAPKRLYLDTSPRRFLKLLDVASLIELTGNLGPTDYPLYFGAMGRSTIAFAPLYTGSTTGELLYYAAPATLVSDSDTNVVLTAYPYLYLYGALEALFRFLEDDNQTDRYGALFGALLQSVNDEEAADAMKGPLQGSASGAIV